ncbi:peptidase dimerization domain-containing protein, partial [Salmonella sp. s51228]|uniref:peptidase dimerization domain-containing protein n=1 Tax=Salmonella sp. s51228 TaxID=3159652 RepID=UPI0039802853
MELADEACRLLQAFFYENYPTHKDEAEYNFLGSSTMKPTRLEQMQGSFNQLPSWVEISGDVRLVPFYKHDECREALIKKVEELNTNITDIPTRGPHSKYEITVDGTVYRGKLSLNIAEDDMAGIFCSKESIGFKSLNESTKKILGDSKPYSVGG